MSTKKVITHDDLVKKAARWLFSRFKCKVILTEFNDLGYEIPDAIGFSYNMSVLVEVKVNRADYTRDVRKRRLRPWFHAGNYRYYMCPEGLIKPEEVPRKWGLVYAKPVKGKVAFRCTIVKEAVGHWTVKTERKDSQMLRTALRRLWWLHGAVDYCNCGWIQKIKGIDRIEKPENA